MALLAVKLILLLLPLTVFADIPQVYPKLDRQVQVNVSSVMWPDRIFIRWKQDNGTWFCTWINKNLPGNNLTGSSAWLNVELYAITVQSPQNLTVFEKSFCFSWLP